MAQLIRSKLKPHNWLARKRFLKNPLNIVIDHAAIARNTQNMKALQIANSMARSFLLDFNKHRRTYAEEASQRSIQRHQARLVIETIFTLIEWQTHIKNEAQAILMLAHKIADSITHSVTNTEITSSQLETIAAEMTGLLQWRLAIPNQVFNDIGGRFDEILGGFPRPIIVTTHTHSNAAELWIETRDLSFKIDFSSADIEKILSTVQNQVFRR